VERPRETFVPAQSPFGVQPARQALYNARWTVARAAGEIDVNGTHLFNCLYGKCPPSPDVRDRLPALLGLPLSALFTAESLAKKYGGPRGSYRLARAGDR
jgi:hypothetical protein